MDVPLISIIIVNFNGGPLLTRAVEAALASAESVEALVVDNRSTDNSLKPLQRRYDGDTRLHITQNHKNRGFAQAANIGLRQARGEYLLLLNPDALVGLDTLTRMVEVMQANPEAGMAGCRIVHPDGAEQLMGRRRTPTPERSLAEFMPGWLRRKLRLKGMNIDGAETPAQPEEVEAISGSFMFVRRAALQKVGLLDERYFLHCEDLDWCMRFRQRGWRILFIPDVQTIHYKGVCSKDRPIRVEWHKHRGMAYFHNKFFKSQYPAPVTAIVWIGIWLHFAWAAALLSLRNGLQWLRQIFI